MHLLIVALASMTASGLTLFSGFGLGTVLLPVFALYFPIEVAIGATAIVHLLNNLVKVGLVGRHADLRIVARFGLPALVMALLGAQLLLGLAELAPLATYVGWGREYQVLPVKLVVAILMLSFAMWELHPRTRAMAIDTQWLPVGGALSGFFGGVSGHQGALRSAFLLQCGLSKEGFIGTGVVIACLVDVARLMVYRDRFTGISMDQHGWLLLVAVSAACCGAWIGARLMTRVTLQSIQWLVAALLVAIAVGLGSGVL